MVTFQQLRQASPEPLVEFGDLARKLARELDQFGADTMNVRSNLASAWEGQDASAAIASLSKQSNGYRESASSYGRVDTIITTFADQVRQAKQTLESAVSMAPSIPGHIDANGGVHINIAALGPNPSPAAVAMAQARAQQVHGYLTQAIVQATQADATAQGALSQVMGIHSVRAASPGTTQIPPEGTDPNAVKSWWDGLSEAEQQDLIQNHSKEIGGLDGVPTLARDAANRIAVDQELVSAAERVEQLREQQRSVATDMTDAGPSSEYNRISRELYNAEREQSNLEMIKEQANRTENMHGSTERLYLIDYDAAKDGQVVIAAGNPDTAQNVVTYVPGMNTEVSNIPKDVDRALMMQADATAADPSQRTAAVTWFGYDAPDNVFGAARGKYFEDAAGDLTSFQHGLRATHEGEFLNNTLLGHSYGSSTVGFAVSQSDLGIDNLVLVASPGGSVENVSEYVGMDDGQVWATRAPWDAIGAVSSVHGDDPVESEFGARVFASDKVSSWNIVANHSGYWEEGNQARDHFANIATGHPERVPIAPFGN